MKLTTHQRATLRHLLAYCETVPNKRSVELFFQHTDMGIKPAWGDPDWNNYCQLLRAHHMISGAQAQMWFDGVIANGCDSYPLTWVVDESFAESTPRTLPVFADAFALWLRLHDIVVQPDEILRKVTE